MKKNLTKIPSKVTKKPNTNKPLIRPKAPFDVSALKAPNGNISLSIGVYIDSKYTKEPSLHVDSSWKKFYVQYDCEEGVPEEVTPWTITATLDSCPLKLGEEITIYNRDTDPITSRGTTTTVKQSTD